ncbi:MAG: hypothetical protein LBQ28_02240 [Prevotellaceae bacterium]|jgi:hypothetical protein|nr:hypothetical protein [Prevotellaceae bacterium]
MKKIILLLTVVLFTHKAYSQVDNCEYSETTNAILERVQYFQNRFEQVKDASYYNADEDRLSVELNIVYYLSTALKNNPKCEEILIQLAYAYKLLGIDEYDFTSKINTKEWKDTKKWIEGNNSITQININNPQFFDKALEKLNYLLSVTTDEEAHAEAIKMRLEIFNLKPEYKKKAEQNRMFDNQIKMEKKRKKDAIDEARNHASFFQIAVGTGFSYGTLGVKPSLFMRPMGLFFTGSVGLGDIPWSVGGGYSFGLYKINCQMQFLYGKVKYPKLDNKKYGSVYWSMNLNVDIYNGIGIMGDVGGWMPISDYSDKIRFGGSIGIYIKFSMY